jgi:molybdopterin molybdotransferase
MRELISVEEAEAIIVGKTSRCSGELVSLDRALGRTLAAPVACDMDIPPFDNSAMDGYAVRAADVMEVPLALPVSQEIPAGVFPDRSLKPRTCARIMTGAPLPAGADSVVPIEWTQGDDPVTFERSPAVGNAVRRAGEDVREGDIVFRGGELITPPIVGMLAAVGCARVPVVQPPRCAVITTGNELVAYDTKPRAGQIRNSNGPALAALVEAAGGTVSRAFTATDDRLSLRACLDACQPDDIVVLSGGVSVGAYDYVREVLEEAGVELHFWRVLQRPGKPLLFGTAGDTLVFGLPGNPVSSSICFDRYVRPAIGRMLGRRDLYRPIMPASLLDQIHKVKELRYFARGFLRTRDDGSLEVTTTGPQGSGIYSSMAHADCIIHLPAEDDAPRPGDMVSVELLTWWD